MYTLNKIFKHYKKLYNLNTIIDIIHDCDRTKTYYHTSIDSIVISKRQIIKLSKKRMNKRSHNTIKNNKQLYLFALLHEINHALEYRDIHFKVISEFNKIDTLRYNTDKKYHDSRPCEKRSDIFATKELKNWI